MFEWKVEEMRLRNERQRFNKVYDFEYNVSREDKIAFVNQMQDGKLSYILDLIEKFKSDEKYMKKNNIGVIKTVSLKSWIKRNDHRKILDDSYEYGRFYILDVERYIQHVDAKSIYEIFSDLVDELFHRQLVECRRMEDSYFKEHDEYEILKNKFRNRKYGTTFGVNISFWSSGKICVRDENGNERDITVDELKELLDKYDQLDKLVEKLTAETHIVY